MDGESKCANPRCAKSNPSPTTSSSPISPTLNLMEQLLLAKMEKHSVNEEQQDRPNSLLTTDGESRRARPKSSLLRTDSMDSQTSASTFSSLLSNDSGSGSNRYCRCDDCLLGIADKYQQSQASPGRKKVNAYTGIIIASISTTIYYMSYCLIIKILGAIPISHRYHAQSSLN